MDEFKKYLQDNHEKMDADAPGEKLWQRIQTTGKRKKKTPVRSMVFRIAAAACFTVIAFFTIKRFFTAAPAAIATTIKDTAPNTNGHTITADNILNHAPADTLLQTGIVKTNTAVTPAEIQKPAEKPSEPQQLLASFEDNYSKLVAMQLNNIRTTPVYNETEEYFAGLKKQFRQAEHDESDIKNAIKKTGLTDELLQQLVAVYQQKVNLLKTLQNQISVINKKVKENHTAADSLETNFINI